MNTRAYTHASAWAYTVTHMHSHSHWLLLCAASGTFVYPAYVGVNTEHTCARMHTHGCLIFVRDDTYMQPLVQ
jgi:hypothetical protein